ncbi:hypothetical protein CB1_001536003 [Camelus ferus]|nr:hypothetical protein CB1_001536003 [Camelus ferus]
MGTAAGLVPLCAWVLTYSFTAGVIISAGGTTARPDISDFAPGTSISSSWEGQESPTSHRALLMKPAPLMLRAELLTPLADEPPGGPCIYRGDLGSVEAASRWNPPKKSVGPGLTAGEQSDIVRKQHVSSDTGSGEALPRRHTWPPAVCAQCVPGGISTVS